MHFSGRERSCSQDFRLLFSLQPAALHYSICCRSTTSMQYPSMRFSLGSEVITGGRKHAPGPAVALRPRPEDDLCSSARPEPSDAQPSQPIASP